MEKESIILASTGRSLARAEKMNGTWSVTHSLEGIKINCLVKHPEDNQKFYLGTQQDGVFFSNDSGITWQKKGMAGIPVKSLAIDPNDPQVLYAGCKPVSLYQSTDGGEIWHELGAMRKTRRWWWFSPADPPGITPYVNAVAVSPDDPNVLLAGIELGALLRSEDKGLTWTGHLRGADRDCHSLKFHPKDGAWVYEGGGFGVSMSRDGGKTWHKPKEGLGSKYGWMVTADPENPHIWYLSASEQSNLLRGEFNPPGHNDGAARAHIYRKVEDSPWEQLSGGLPEPMDYMAYDLATIAGKPGLLYAGLANGEIWHGQNFGDQWEKLPLNVGRVDTALIVI